MRINIEDFKNIYNDRSYKIQDIAKMYNVTNATIFNIVRKYGLKKRKERIIIDE